jgi:ribulose-5-phosphate 4-epimerase/fuculose-1-phosphate aldolase
VVDGEAVQWRDPDVPVNLRQVVDHCISKGAYKPVLGKTAGHFAVKVDDQTFLTSARKTNFNELNKIGLVKVVSSGPDHVMAYGRKPSVGGQSQRIIFSEHPELDCIVHFHCPPKENMTVPTAEQWPNECGSHECGKNTSGHLKEFDLGDGDKLKMVYLDKHGPNIVFNRQVPAAKVIDFINTHFDLSKKTGGMVVV